MQGDASRGLVEERAHQVAVQDPHLAGMLADELDGADRIRLLAELDEPSEGAADRRGGAKRARRTKDPEDLLVATGHRERHPFDVGRGRRRELGGAELWDLGAVAARDRRDLLRVRGDEDRAEDAALARRRDRIGEERMAGELAHVLAGNALRAGARRDQSDRRGVHTASGSWVT